MSANDALMSQLVEMGFEAQQAATYSSSYASLEAALEAIFRDEAAAAQQAPSAPAAPPSPASVSIPSASTRIPPPPSLVTVSEERKEESPLALSASEWIPLCLVPSSPLSPSTPDELDRELQNRGPAPPSLLQADEANETAQEFEVLHSSLFTAPDSTSSLRKWSANKLRALFDKLEASVHATELFCPDVASPTETRLETPSETSSNSSSNSATPLTTLSACSTPRNNNCSEADEDTLCVICLDRTRDTLLLPCRHLSLCSCCALDFVSRVRAHNHEVYLVQLAAAEEARQSNFLMPTVHKKVQRVCACPTCATPVQQCVRRRNTNVK